MKVVALGAGWVAAVTSFNYLRIFSEGGLQVCRTFISYLHVFSFSITKYWIHGIFTNVKGLRIQMVDK